MLTPGFRARSLPAARITKRSRYLACFKAVLPCLLLASCAQTRVHFYVEGMDGIELERLRSSMAEQGYKVVLNTRPVPAEVAGPRLVYSPGQKSLQDINLLSSWLRSEGYAVQLVPESIGNNFYTPDNVGLYLLPFAEVASSRNRSNRLEAGMSLAGHEFAGECPGDEDAYLDLAEGPDFRLDMLGWDDSSGTETAESLAGTWRQSGDLLLLSLDGQELTFRQEAFRQEFQVRVGSSNQTRVVAGLRLINTGTALGQCDFVQRRQL